ncbi:MAG: hypothetical protein K2H47_07385 [Muribaculaceae bacterium]|nr:hypothetical protein [Muribaculaceae bacterium]
MTHRLLTGLLASWAVFSLSAQVTTTPSPLQEDSQNVVIYYHADEGTKGLMGQPASDPIYAHTGVLTSSSTGSGDWKYAPTWGDNSAKYQLQYVSENLWKLEMGDIRAYYGLTDPSETIEKLAFVFRNAACNKEGKADGGGDIFVDVYATGLQIAFQSSVSGSVLTPDNASNVVFKAATTRNADITITVNGTPIGSADGVMSLEATHTFAGVGDYTVTATAVSGGETVSSTLDYAYVGASTAKDYPGGVPRMGAVRNTDGSVNFCLAAPNKESALIVGSWNDYKVTDSQTMYYQDYNGARYFWTTVDGLAADRMYMYYYMVDATYKVGDPYAKLILDPWNDKYIPESVYPDLPQYPADKVGDNVSLAVYQENINDYTWRHDDFKRPVDSDLVIYELLLRDFTGTEGEAYGNGTVKGAIEKLPYLKSLGVNAIELLPINEFNGNISWGYNPNFYFAPDKAYGTPDDYKRLIDLCHANGMAVILDMVFNQTDWQHPWYLLYPVGQNPFYNATAPHAYSVLNDWNQGYPLVQQQFKDVLRYWLEEYHVDGFRFDLVKGLGDNDSYANNSDAATNAYNASRVARMKELHDAMREVDPTAYFINENLAGAKEENDMAADGELNWANINNAGCQFAMGYSSDSDMSRFYAPMDDNRLWGSTVSYLESHDEQRLAYKQDQWGVAGVKGDRKTSMQRLGSAAAQMLMAPGAHMIWQFSEMGNAQSTKDDSNGNNTNPKIVDWALLDNEYNAGLVQNYSELIAVRLGNPEMFVESASFASACRASDWNNGRWLQSRADGKELLTVVNPNTTGVLTLTFDFLSKDNADYQILSKSYGSEPTFNATTGTVSVEGNCYVVIGSKSLSAVKTIGDDNVRVNSCNGVLEVAGMDGGFSVVSIDGRVLYRTADSSGNVALPQGLYIVTGRGRTVRTMVR